MSIMRRHWEGNLDLGTSFWVFGYLGQIVVIVVSVLLSEMFLQRTRNDALMAVVLYSCWGTIFVYAVWQVVGVWRSATKTKMRGSILWGGLAQFFVLIWSFLFSVQIAIAAQPQLTEITKIAFFGDPDIPPYLLAIDRERKALFIHGGIKKPLAADISSLFEAEGDSIKTVILNSGGGRISEAVSVASILEPLGVKTYVPSACYSACVLIFLSGTERVVSPNGELGLHQVSIDRLGLSPKDQISSPLYVQLKQREFPENLLIEAIETVPEKMFIPQHSLLLESEVITAIDELFPEMTPALR